MKWLFGVLCFALIGLPHMVFASVIINEIAWMGDVRSANNEWIELKNTGSENINLKGLVLEASDGVPRISLAGTSTAQGFFLLERTDDDSVPGIAADQMYSGALSNSGEKLLLKDASGVVVDSVDALAGWPAGDNTTKQTMQRLAAPDGVVGVKWLTAIATPRAENANPPKPPVVKKSLTTTQTKTKMISPELNSNATKQPENIGIVNSAQPIKVSSDLYWWLLGSIIAGLGIGISGVMIKKRLSHEQF